MDPTSSAALAQTGAQTKTTEVVDVSYDASLTTDMSTSFSSHMDKVRAAQNTTAVTEPSEAARAVFKPLDRLNSEAQELVQYAQEAAASGNDLSPSEIIMLTVRSQEFMFHAQLTANVANRTADGMSQLFRQQG